MLLKIFQNIVLTKGINEKNTDPFVSKLLIIFLVIDDWLSEDFVKKNNF